MHTIFLVAVVLYTHFFLVTRETTIYKSFVVKKFTRDYDKTRKTIIIIDFFRNRYVLVYICY